MLGLKIFVPVQTRNFCHSAVRFIIYWTISIFQAFFSPISSAIKLKVFCVQKARGKCFFPKTTLPHRLLSPQISKFEWEKPEFLKEWCWKYPIENFRLASKRKNWILRLWMAVASKRGVVHVLDNNLIWGKSLNNFIEGFKWNTDFVFCPFAFLPF